MIEFSKVTKQVYSSEEAMVYLNLSTRSALDNLVNSKRLTPLKIAKANCYAKFELDDFIARELKKEQRLRGISKDDT